MKLITCEEVPQLLVELTVPQLLDGLKVVTKPPRRETAPAELTR